MSELGFGASHPVETTAGTCLAIYCSAVAGTRFGTEECSLFISVAEGNAHSVL